MTIERVQLALSAAHHNLLSYAKIQMPSYQVANHHRLIADALQRVEQGKCTRLLISVAPRHGKTLLCSELFPAWYLGRNPGNQVIFATYSQDFANTTGGRVRNYIADPTHSMVFPNCQLSKDSKSKQDFTTSRGGQYRASGAEGQITGRGAHVFIIDDLLKNRTDARSPAMRRQSRDFYSSTAYTRLMPGNSAIVVIGTRWDYEDLIGWLEREHTHENWEVLNLPAINEYGEALWPEKFPLSKLAQIKLTLEAGGNTRDWEPLYMQRPVPESGNIFKREWWQYYTTAPKFKTIIQSWDTAYEKGKTSDFSACITLGVAKDGFYVLDCWKGKLEFPELKRTIQNLANKWRPQVILMEKAASGRSLIHEFKRESTLSIIPVKAKESKRIRADIVTPIFESGRVFIPERASWAQDLIDDCSRFQGDGKGHDDTVDALTQSLTYAQRRTSSGAFADYITMKAGKHDWINTKGTHYECTHCGQQVMSISGNPDETARIANVADCTLRAKEDDEVEL